MKRPSNRPSKLQLQSAHFATLYPNGVVILQHAKEDKDAGRVEWVTAWETTSYTNRAMHFGARTLALLFAPDFRGVRYVADNGSEATREHRLNVGSAILHFAGYELDYLLLPGLVHTDVRPVASGYDAAPDMEKLRASPFWHSCPVSNLR